MIDKNKRILCIVESPNKVSTITKIFKDAGYTSAKVMASVGHITEIKDGGSYWNTGIDPEHNFKINYAVSSHKKEVVTKLQDAVSKADVVYLATDPDREGEAISWHLKRQLKITDNKYQRITFHEITKSAILKALEEPRKIDDDLVKAAQSRQVVDKLVGYRLSPIARENINAKSVGRCQSAGLKVIAIREDEILNFKVEKYYDLYLHFFKNNTEFKAKYVGTVTKDIKRLEKIEECNKIKEECKNHDFVISNIEQKKQNDNPKPPFTTSTFQQEANKALGLSVDAAMSCAQKLFEGLNVGGDHIALITYIRTDDASMAPEFLATLQSYVKTVYGPEYCGKLQQGKKSENTQEAHECLRCINVSMTPADLEKYITDRNLLRVYKLIWERTVMSTMTPAVINDTQYTITNNDYHKFVMHSREVEFDGYRRVHVDTEDEVTKDDIVKEKFDNKEILKETSLIEELKETTPPSRYTEATFIKELDKQGIGRPSTYAAIVKTLLSEDRGYCRVEKKYIIPTDKGIGLSRFLDKQFPELINLNYTCEMEKDLDLIANNKLDYLQFLNNFYVNLEESAKKASVDVERICPNCGSKLVKRKGKYGYFYGCSNYPKCKYIEKLNK